jgi:hypothetical protein
VADAAAGRANVEPEGQLTIGPRRYEVEPAAVTESDGGEEVRYSVTAVIFEGDRRHRESGVVGEQSDQQVDVAGLVGAGELGDKSLLGG